MTTLPFCSLAVTCPSWEMPCLAGAGQHAAFSAIFCTALDEALAGVGAPAGRPQTRPASQTPAAARPRILPCNRHRHPVSNHPTGRAPGGGLLLNWSADLSKHSRQDSRADQPVKALQQPSHTPPCHQRLHITTTAPTHNNESHSTWRQAEGCPLHLHARL